MQCCDRFLYYYILTVISPPNLLKTALSLALHQHPCLLINALLVSHTHYPSKISNNLASLVKGRWLDGNAQALTLLRLLAAHQPFLFTKLFRRQDGGIVFLPHPFRFSDTSVDNPSIVGSASHCNRSSPLHKGAKGDSSLPALLKTALSSHTITIQPNKTKSPPSFPQRALNIHKIYSVMNISDAPPNISRESSADISGLSFLIRSHRSR